MNARWFVLLSAAIFLAFVTVLSLYITSDDGASHPAARSARSIGQDDVRDDRGEEDGHTPREQFARVRMAREQQSRRQRSTASRPPPRRKSRPSWSETVNRLAEQADEAAVRFRSNAADSAAAQIASGFADIRQGRADAAAERFDRALAKTPGDATVLSARAAALVAARRFEEAAVAYAQAVRASPRDAIARYNYGVVLCRLSRFAEAEEQFRGLVELEPDSAEGWYSLATLAQRAGRIGEARLAWETFTQLQPDVGAGWFNLGVVWMDFDGPLEAAACFAKATQIDPRATDAWLNLGLAYAAAGHLDAALEAMTEADELAPCHPLVLRCLGELHALLADQGGSDADRHQRLARAFQEQVNDLVAGAIGAGQIAARQTENN